MRMWWPWQEAVLLLLTFVLCQRGDGQLSRSTRRKVAIHALIPEGGFFKTLNRTLFADFSPRARRKLGKYRNLRYFDFSARSTILHDDTPNEILQAFCDTSFSSNAVVLFHINNPLSMKKERLGAHKYISQLADYYGLPLISWDSEFSPSARPVDSRRLQLAPTLYHQASAMLDMLRRYNWSDFTVVTTQTFGHYDFLSSLRALTRESQEQTKYTSTGTKTFKFTILSEVLISDGSNNTEVLARLNTVVNTHTRVFLLHASSSESKNILDVAAKIGLTTKDYVWIITSTALSLGYNNRVVRSYPYGLFAISFESGLSAMKDAITSALTMWFETINKVGNDRTINLNTSFSCKETKRQFWNDGGDFFNYLKNSPSQEFNDTGVLKHTSLQILNIQRSDRNYPIAKEVGTWTKDGLVIQGITWPGESTEPPKGKPEKYFLRIVTWKEDPYVMYRDFDNRTGMCEHNAVACRVYSRNDRNERTSNVTNTTCCTGLSIDILRIFAEELNFDFELFEVADGQWGAENSYTKEWNGIIGVLKENKADMAVTSLTVTPERAKQIDFSVPFLETGITIMVSIRDGKISPTAFLEPYDYPSWCLILVFSVHATGASIFIFEWLSPYGLDQGKTPLRDHKFSLFRSFWLIWAMLFSAAVSTDTPRGVSSRFLSNLWALFALVFLASYTANLAAFMITKEQYYDLSGIKDWRLRNPHHTKPPFKFATVPNGSTDLNMRKNYAEMHEYMKKYNRPTVQQGIAALKKQEIQAFIYDATVLEYYVGRDDVCKLIVVGDWYATTGYAIGLPKGSPWLDKINTVLLKMQDTGEVEKLHKFWLSGACKKKKQKGVSSHTLGILNFTSAFILLGGGMVLGAILLLAEHLYFRFGRKSLRKWDKCGCCSLVSLSMGKSLTFEQSVMEAIDYHKRHKCKDPICETQLWKVRHELDLAMLKVDILQRQLSLETGGRGEDGAGIWRYDPEATRQHNGISRRRAKDRVEPIGGELAKIEPLMLAHPSEEDPPIEVMAEANTLASPSSGTDGDSGDRDTPKRSRRLDGKYYFGVEDNVEMESAF
ncbi:glutamate receptor ionotropic, NMDA 2B-like [Haliotis rufescens]|uniref:glutamate receptor ionotropic, NMDA 2B-like n=1 Tax=Haliotis rufescens TaxID=6454 RepID=UPI00201E88B4|nr:glutamate receptor ionotropic, NMDA 2B-like [Haliotis rufescens]XP_046372600.2 glutamate receptor ionotropic, NMDA 2B-like [Haliotis rufescens]XP_048248146.1 glutamate receptor ionotropic, NMDA 2B-like [Haliotis rufescens]